MPLFPAYGENNVEDVANKAESQDAWEATESREAQLLASDTDDEAPAPRAAPAPAARDDFYLDSKLDRGNLRVSTLYYPGRPQYERHGKILAGGRGAGEGARRYWARRAADAPDAAAAAERAAAYRSMLRDRPTDVRLWERFIDFQEVCSGAEAALTAAEEAAEHAPHSRRLRTRLLAAAAVALPREQLLRRLRELLTRERSARRRVELWERLLEAAGGAAAGAAAVRAAAAAAVADTRAYPPAYPRLLHAYGVFLRMAGLWEELVLLVELLAAMTCAPAAFPPPAPAAAERRLRELEERALGGGLPLPAVWVRVERARAGAHWRPAPAAPPPPDPQRAPLPHDLADLLQPLVGERHALLLCAALLRLAKVPPLPGAGGPARAWPPGAPDCAEALLPLLRAARRLPPAHPARLRPRPARRLLQLLLDPPHYFSDDTGYLSWVRSLWDACCGWVTGERRVALLCWRLRWLHALLLLVDREEDGGAEEVRETNRSLPRSTFVPPSPLQTYLPSAQVARIRDEARAALKRFGDGSPLAFGQFARIEREAGGGERAGRAALRALRAALAAAAPQEHALHVARIAYEVSATGEPGADRAALGAVAAAVLGRPPPLEPQPPSADDLQEALRIVSRTKFIYISILSN
ncbi:uncharacterized protein [Epargyreus clarus]|uniref:uncharacterized protein n=1 Tax=Epargyreus clarus TaxID=520877 RepID=UPI003C302243